QDGGWVARADIDGNDAGPPSAIDLLDVAQTVEARIDQALKGDELRVNLLLIEVAGIAKTGHEVLGIDEEVIETRRLMQPVEVVRVDHPFLVNQAASFWCAADEELLIAALTNGGLRGTPHLGVSHEVKLVHPAPSVVGS